MAERVEVRGLRELQDALKKLPKKLERRVLNSALSAGARIMVKDAKNRAPVLKDLLNPNRRPGTLKKNIRARPIKPYEHTASVIVGVRKLSSKAITAFKKSQSGKKGGSQNPNDPFYWRFVEFGTSKMQARPFLRPAFEAKKFEAATTIKQKLKVRIELEAEKLNRVKI